MSENFAVIRLNSKQFIVQKGQTFKVDRVSPESEIQVLMAEVDGNVLFGEPVLDKFGVKIEVLEDKKDEKIEVRRYKSKSRYRKHKGHRQPISVITVADLGEKIKNELVWSSKEEAPVEQPKVKKVKKAE